MAVQGKITDEQARINKIIRELILKIKKQCRTEGSRIVTFQLDFLKDHPGTPLPTELDHTTTIQCYITALREHKDELFT